MVLLASAVAVGACTKDARVETRSVTLHAPLACAPGSAAFGLYFPYGDFAPPSAPTLALASVGSELGGMPDDTQELIVQVTDATEGAWLAHSLLPASGNVDLLLLADESPCALTDAIDARTGAAAGAVDASHVLIAGGAPTERCPRRRWLTCPWGLRVRSPSGCSSPGSWPR